jgi:putative transposase
VAHQQQCSVLDPVLEVLESSGLDGLASALTLLLNEIMKLERTHFLNADPYQRSSDRRGHANGFKPKTVRTRVGELQLNVPQVRDTVDGQLFYPSMLEQGIRSERALKLALAEMYVNGVSTRKVAKITREMCGFDVTSTEVSRAAQALDEELEEWRNRPLDRFDFLILDARYEKVRHGGTVVSTAVLSATGIDPDGRRSVLGVSVALSEAEVHWREFLSSLVKRNLHGVQLVISDDHEGLKAALRAVFPSIPWQRCQVHLQRNAAAYVPRQEMKPAVASTLRNIMQAATRIDADRLLGEAIERYRESAPRLASWMEDAIPEGLTVLEFPEAWRRKLRTTNAQEWINKEIKRRTRVATLFPNEASLLRLVTAVLIEISQEWEIGRRYLTPAE